jgi:hypothetical protein
MELSRYTFEDAYILEELKREYQRSDARSRIRLVRRLYQDDGRPPYEIAVLAIEDSHVEVREWIARHGRYLNYQERSDADHPERNLLSRLKNDPDPFVRTCVNENPALFGGLLPWSNPEEWKEAFRNASHLERLALVRNPRVDEKLIEQIFDHEDQELGISLEVRGEFVRGFLTNYHAIRDSFKGKFDFIDGWDSYSTRWHFSQLWKLISKWPGGTGNLQAGVYRHIGAPDETKAEIYQSCDEPVWREVILINSDRRDTQTIKLGMHDPNEHCRELAYSRVDISQIHELDRILQGEDSAALRGLSQNHALPADVLRQVSYRLVNEIDHWYANKTIEEVERRKPPSALGDKLDFIYEKFQSFEENTKQSIERIEIDIRSISRFFFNIFIAAIVVAAIVFIINPLIGPNPLTVLIEWLSSIFRAIPK